MAFGQTVFTQGLADAQDKGEWQHHWYVENGDGARTHVGSNAAGAAYAFGKLGGNACPRGYAFIGSLAECAKAAAALTPGNWTRSTRSVDYGTHNPKGCFYDGGHHIGGKDVFFNNNSVGGFNQAGDRAICKQLLSAEPAWVPVFVAQRSSMDAQPTSAKDGCVRKAEHPQSSR